MEIDKDSLFVRKQESDRNERVGGWYKIWKNARKYFRVWYKEQNSGKTAFVTCIVFSSVNI